MSKEKIQVNIEDILTDEFIREYTGFYNVDDFIISYPIDDDKPILTEEEKDKWISEFSVFKTYKEFELRAVKDFTFINILGEDHPNRFKNK